MGLSCVYLELIDLLVLVQDDPVGSLQPPLQAQLLTLPIEIIDINRDCTAYISADIPVMNNPP
jgi:hypothetical protein